MKVIRPSIDIVRVTPKYLFSEKDILVLLVIFLSMMFVFKGKSLLIFLPYPIVFVLAALLFKIRKNNRPRVIRDHLSLWLDYIVEGKRMAHRNVEVVGIENIGDDYLWFTSEGSVGISFELNPLDIDIETTGSLERQIDSIFGSLDENSLLLINYYTKNSQDLESKASRSRAMNDVGFNRVSVVCHIYQKISFFKKLMGSLNAKDFYLNNKIEDLKKSLKIKKSLNCGEIQALFVKGLPSNYKPFGRFQMTEEGELFSVMKMEEVYAQEYTDGTLSYALENTAFPIDLFVKQKKIGRGLSMLRSGMILQSEKGASDKVSALKSIEAEDTQAEIRLFKQGFVDWEMHAIVSGENRREIEEKEKHLEAVLAPIGKFKAQSYGQKECLFSLQPGTKFHYSIPYKKTDIYSVSPLLSAKPNVDIENNNRLVLFHRMNGVVDGFDPFDPKYSHFSGNIIGESGSGKSMFVNLQLDSLSNDPDTHILLVDVKASHHQKIEELGGEVIEMSLDQPPKFNPFSILHYSKDNSTIVMLSQHLESLASDKGKSVLSAVDRADLGKAVKEFTQNARLEDLNLDGFLEKVKDLPHRKLFERYSSDGIYPIFGKSIDRFEGRQITYFSLKDIHSASNSDVARVLMSAVKMRYYTLLKAKKTSERLMFINDEAVFFISEFSKDYEFLSTNLRAFNGGIQLVVQYPNQISEYNKALMDHISYNIYFKPRGADVNRGSAEYQEKVKKEYGLSDGITTDLVNLRTEIGNYAEFMIMDSHGYRRGRIITSLEEYWMATTHPIDRSVVEKVQNVLGVDQSVARKVMVFTHEASGRENYAY